MSEESFEYIYTPCDRENKTCEAVKHCVECNDYYCQSCTDSHKRFSPLIGHSLLDVGHGKQTGNQPTNSPEFPTERCSIHKGKIVDMFCEKHNTVGCYVCIAKDHKLCPESQIYSVPDMLDTLFKLSDIQQNRGLLKQTIASMTTLGDSADIRLEALNKAKKRALDQIAKFQRILETIFRNAADSSRQEVEKAYKKIENEILQNKRNVDDTIDALQNIGDKLNKATANRAQQFVCSKMSEKNIKEAKNEKLKQPTYDNTEMDISFHPNYKLKDYIQGLHGIGEVRAGEEKRCDLYKLKSSRDINIKISGDTNSCYSYGCCLTDHQLIVTDHNNKKVKRFGTQSLTIIDNCTLDSFPYEICCASNKDEVAVACKKHTRSKGNNLSNTQFNCLNGEAGVCCDGKDNIIVACRSSNSIVQFHENGKNVGVIVKQKEPISVYFHTSLNRIFVTIRDSDILRMYELE
ncbi:hypothetical protein ACF0H5_016938 [Mactra antiquata]